MTCIKCNYKLADNQVICPQCGYNNLKKPGGGQIIAGWIFTIIGAIAAIVLYVILNDKYGRVVGSIPDWMGGSRSTYKTLRIVFFVSIGVAVLGVIFLIVGYVNRASASKRRNMEMMAELIKDGKKVTPPIIPGPTYPSAYPPAKPAGDDPVKKLEQLKELLDKEVITEADFEQKKSEIISKM